MSEKKKYIATDGRKVWYSNKIVFDPASGVLELDDGLRVILMNPDKFKFFELKKEAKQ